MIYFDAAYIAKCYLNERDAGPVRRLATSAQGLVSSELGRVEFTFALHRHLREGHIGSRGLLQVLGEFHRDEEQGVWRWLPLTSALLARVSDLVTVLPRTIALRTGDAIHLVSAREHGCREIYTNDRQVLAAARWFDLVAVDVLTPAGGSARPPRAAPPPRRRGR